MRQQSRGDYTVTEAKSVIELLDKIRGELWGNFLISADPAEEGYTLSTPASQKICERAAYALASASLRQTFHSSHQALKAHANRQTL
jgi:hypothetical protein